MTQEHATTPHVGNSAFLRELSAGAERGSSLWVTSFVGSPDLTEVRSWYGKPYNPALMTAQVDGWGQENAYYSVAALVPTADGEVKRRKANFGRLLALVVDDVQLEDIRGQVSYVLTTSPGKIQVGILIDRADPDAANSALVDRLVTTMVERGMLRADSSGNNSVRYVRLPVGQNQKPRDSGAWQHALTTWNPSVRMSLNHAAAAFGVDLDEARNTIPAATAGTLGLQDERVRSYTADVVRGENLHDSLNGLAASMVATHMPGGAVVNVLRGLMDASMAPRDERFMARYADIPRAVTTAQQKFTPAQVAMPAAPSDVVLTMAALEATAGNIHWAVKGVIPEQGIGFFYGANQAFKSFVALDYALHRAYGLKWMGRRTKQAIPVYLAAEGGAGILRRIRAWHKARDMDWTGCPMRVVIVPFTLRTQSPELRKAIQACGIAPGDVIVDTMSQTFTGNENSNDEVADWLRILGTELRDALSCTVSVVHHTGHTASDRPRGASAIISNTDFALGVFRDGKEMLCSMEFSKVKDSERPDDVSFGLSVVDLGRDVDGDPITSLSAKFINNAEELVQAHQSEARAGRSGRSSTLLSLVQNGMTEKELRKAFYDVVDITDIDKKKVAFYRARDAATKAGFFEIAGLDRRIIVLKEWK